MEHPLVEYADGVTRPVHSIKGASSAERWMNCPGSSALIEAFGIPEVTDEPSYRAEGVAMHEAAAFCLARDIDAWEIVGDTYNAVLLTEAMCDGIQMYLDRVRPGIDRQRGFINQQFFIEAKLAAPDVHAQMFGSVDFAALVPAYIPSNAETDADVISFLDITDLKGGEGIVVDPEDNPQMKYYAFMLIHSHFPGLDDEFPVRLTIVQPRAFSYEGPVRDWWTTVGDIKAWVIRDLLPAMHSTDDSLQSGMWCRFCPAKLICPLLASLFKAAVTYDPKSAARLDNVQLGLSYSQIQAAEFYIKAIEDEVFRRMSSAQDIPGAKLVNKKANRIFKATVTETVEGEKVEVPFLDAIKVRFGDKAFTAPKLKSPPEFEKISVEAKEFVKQYAYMPVTGLTVAPAADKRREIKIKNMAASETFAAAIANLETGETDAET